MLASAVWGNRGFGDPKGVSHVSVENLPRNGAIPVQVTGLGRVAVSCPCPKEGWAVNSMELRFAGLVTSLSSWVRKSREPLRLLGKDVLG